MAVKVLNFYAYHLKKEVVLMLMFEPPNTSQLYVDQFPVAWKIIKFRPNKEGTSKATVHYDDRLAFGYSETEDNNIIDPSAWVDVEVGDVATITGDAGCFGKVVHRTNNDHIICKNRSGARVDISIGFVSGDRVNERFHAVHFWNDVGSGSNVSVEFTPIVKAYVTTDYQESEYLRGDVETEAIWSRNLDELDDETGWNFREDPETGIFTIRRSKYA
ncbi:hypothetical protein FS749_008869 [Ceratobasidium sp. UAMH 11750]|nr:hypothetical protein FS749_008869 [Ceratobasidium sp. UAMH 11750]